MKSLFIEEVNSRISAVIIYGGANTQKVPTYKQEISNWFYLSSCLKDFYRVNIQKEKLNNIVKNHVVKKIIEK